MKRKMIKYLYVQLNETKHITMDISSCVSLTTYCVMHKICVFKESALRPILSRSRNVCPWLTISCVCPLPMQFFLRPVVGPQVTWSDPGLWLGGRFPPKIFVGNSSDHHDKVVAGDVLGETRPDPGVQECTVHHCISTPFITASVHRASLHQYTVHQSIHQP